MIDVNVLAHEIAANRGEAGLEPVIAKEIVHYEILRLLSDEGHLDALAFQGGTCLRVVYGARRYSEDLDFCAGEAFEDVNPHLLASTLRDALADAFGLPVRVKEPAAGGRDIGKVMVKRWTIAIDTTSARADIPLQKIKLEVADVPFHTREARSIRCDFAELPSSYSAVFVPCESVSEIIADKIVAFANTEKYIRWRDLWDLHAVGVGEVGRTEEVAGLVRLKHVDYGCIPSLAELLGRGMERASQQMHSDAFASEMARFLPRRVVDTTLRRGENRTAFAEELLMLYEDVADELGIAEEAAAARQRLATGQVARLGKEAPARNAAPRRR